MSPGPGNGTTAHTAILLRDDDEQDRARLSDLQGDPGIQVMDRRQEWAEQIRRIRPALTPNEVGEEGRWAYYPWRRTLVRVPGPSAFRRLRLDRNRNKITSGEQDRLGLLTIGVVGLSVGHAIAHTLALEGLCGELRLADFDTIELSNLNRIPGTVLDLGINKAVVAARRIAELDPYLPLRIFPAGLDDENMNKFFDGLDLIVEECDSLDMKVRIRQEARRRGVPVLMETSDRGLFDVERFDLDPQGELFHGLLGDLDPLALQGLSTRDKAPFVMRILQAPEISARMAASMVEIDHTVSTWPQLGGDVQLGAATVAAAVRRFGRGGSLPSGRIRVDLEAQLDRLEVRGPTVRQPQPGPAADLTAEVPTGPVEAMIHAIRLAPSGGNIQPWSIVAGPRAVAIDLVRARTSDMDVRFRGSYVAIGAAAFNARVAAARHHVVGPVECFPFGTDSNTVVTLSLGNGSDRDLAALYPSMIQRISNRNFGHRRPLSARLKSDLSAAAEAEKARVQLITDAGRLADLADLFAESDRIRYLSPVLHGQMMSELRWPGRDRLELGIDVRTLGLDATDLAKLEVAGRPDVMAYLASWKAGVALGDATRDRIRASSAIAVVTVHGDAPADYVRGGMALQRVWVCATQHNLGVQPVSPVGLYARTPAELRHLSPTLGAELSALGTALDAGLGRDPADATVLILRLSHDTPAAVRSERLPRAEIGAPRTAA